MAARLGDVLYWAACLIAGLFLVLAGGQFVFGGDSDRVIFAIILLAIAIITWLIGRAIRYVLAGR
jgi:hypothetical protein